MPESLLHSDRGELPGAVFSVTPRNALFVGRLFCHPHRLGNLSSSEEGLSWDSFGATKKRAPKFRARRSPRWSELCCRTPAAG